MKIIKYAMRVFFALCLWSNVYAQESVVVSGQNISGSGGTISYAIGQVFVGEESDGNYLITQGVQQVKEYYGTLPITLITFTAQLQDGKPNLKWSTTSEYNNSYFEIERSSDGISFERASIISSKGNSSSLINYQFIDENPYNRTTYYRLKQVDFDSKFSYSEIRYVNLILNRDLSLKIFPNPFIDNVNISFISEKEGLTNMMLFDLSGKLIAKKVVNLEKGQNAFSWDLQTLSSGTYFLKIDGEANLNSLIVKNL